MAKHTTPRAEHSSSAQTQALQPAHPQTVEVTDALPIRLHVLDLARHSIAAPDGKRFVVATFDDTHLGRGYMTAIYPQQYNYQTLVRLEIAHFSSPTPEEAMRRHIATLQAIHQGKLADLHTQE